MTDREFWKVESIGNDFVLMRAEDAPSSDPGQIQALCERSFGVGADGLLTLEKLSPTQLKLRMFNPDGTEDFCGNGLRCAAEFAHEEGWVGSQFSIQHLDRNVAVAIDDDGLVTTDLGCASYDPAAVPLARQQPLFREKLEVAGVEILASSLSTGSTHTIIEVDELPEDRTFKRVSSRLEGDVMFPMRTSVIWCRVAGPDHLQIRIWERGAGETMGCGTGSSAAAIHHMRVRGFGGEVRVENPGGTVTVRAEDWASPLTLSGVARTIFHGTWRPSVQVPQTEATMAGRSG